MASALNRTPQQFLDEFAEAKWQELSMEQLKSFCKARNLLHTEIKGKSKADLQDSVQKFLDICAGNLRLFSPKTPAPPAEDSGEHRANSPEVTQLFPAPKASPPDEPHPPVSSEPDALPAKVHPLFTTIQRRHTATILHAWGDYTNQAESVPQWAERLIESLTENKLSVDHRLDGLERHYHALSEGYYTHLDEERRQFAELHAELVKDHYETQMDLTSLRREIQTAERATRSERVTAAGQALLPDTALDPDADAKALLRKTIGRSPVLPEQFLTLGLHANTSCVLAVVEGLKQLEADIAAAWSGTIYTTPGQVALSQLVFNRLPHALLTEMQYGTNPYPLDGTAPWKAFKEQLIQLAMSRDLHGGTPQAWLRAQLQDGQPLNEYIALMSAVLNILPKQLLHDQDVRKTLVDSFDPDVRSLMLRHNTHWVLNPLGGGYPEPADIFRAAYAVHQFQQALDNGPNLSADIDQASLPLYPRINGSAPAPLNTPPQGRSPNPQVYALVNDPSAVLYMPFNIDTAMLQDVLPPAVPWQPDPNAVFSHPSDRNMQEEYFCGVITDLNKLDITTSSDLQLCLRKISQWFGELAQNTWFASQFKTAAKQAIQNVRTGIDRTRQQQCWNCGEVGHLKANCPLPKKRLTDYR
mmetsp:Transcript_43282/g.90642  ORF Transcript_43282/g.90642 Transcript_43282/m.90642 type:complete len:641 (-) Transcript_43282:892-2814(-)